MKLRSKTFLITLFFIFLIFISIYSSSRSIILNDFRELELTYAEKNVNTVLGTLESTFDSLDITVYDWAAWDDTYNFINEPNQDYLDSNIVNETFTALEINIILYLDLNNTIIFVKTFDLETEIELINSAELIDSIMSNNLLFDLPDSDSSTTGLIQTYYGPMMVASRPIQNSEETLPINGILLMGKLIENNLMEHISDTIQLPLNYFSIYDDNPEDISNAEQYLNSTDELMFIQTSNEDYIVGYSMMNDINDSPILIIKLEMTRDIYQHGVGVFNYFLLILFIVMIVIGSLIILAWDVIIVRRLSLLNSEVNTIADNKNNSFKVSVIGKDEISSLANEINKMLNSIENSENILKMINEEQKSRMVDLEQYKKTTIDRELKMIELKEKIKALEQKDGVSR